MKNKSNQGKNKPRKVDGGGSNKRKGSGEKKKYPSLLPSPLFLIDEGGTVICP